MMREFAVQVLLEPEACQGHDETSVRAVAVPDSHGLYMLVETPDIVFLRRGDVVRCVPWEGSLAVVDVTYLRPGRSLLFERVGSSPVDAASVLEELEAQGFDACVLPNDTDIEVFCDYAPGQQVRLPLLPEPWHLDSELTLKARNFWLTEQIDTHGATTPGSRSQDLPAPVGSPWWLQRTEDVSAIKAALHSKDAKARAAAARNRGAPIEIVENLASSDDPPTRAAAAGSPWVSQRVLAALAEDPSEVVRRAVAQNRTTPRSQIDSMLSADVASVRQYAAAHPHASSLVLTRAAKAKSVLVRRGVASNPLAPAQSLHALATDPDMQVRKRVAHNPSTPAQILRALVDDQDDEVTRWLVTNRAAPPDVMVRLAHMRRELRVQAAAAPNSPLELIEELARDEDERIRGVVCVNRTVPLRVFWNLARDPSPSVREQLAIGRVTPAEVMRHLAAHDPEGYVRQTAREAIRFMIAAKFGVPERSRALKALAQLDWRELSPESPEVVEVLAANS
ncbi:hypothetical protein ACNI3K_00505 [Demequina sp. SO4-13]|uniref:hypothetical protein n=1 Tax=Demequina sp. SO4-13 TaxID=3401027 RepID=UPI003AF5B079